MAVAASGSQVKWYYGIEDAAGVIQPAEATAEFTPIRFNTSDLTRDTTQIDSDEINDARQREKSRQGTYSIAGSIAANLSFASHDYLMQAAFQNTWTSQVTITAGTIAAVAATNDFTDSGNGFVAAGFAVGDLVTISGFSGGFAAGGVDFKITAIAAGVMTIGGTDGDAIIDDAAGEDVTIATAGDFLDVGATPPVISLLRRNTDTGVDMLYRSCRLADLGLAVVLNQSAILTNAVVGESAENYTVPVGATFNAATSSEMMVPTIGYMQDAETALTYLTDYNVDFSNNMNPLFSLFQRNAYSVENGVFTAGGSMSAYQPDSTLLDKFLDETQTDHIIKLLDLDGNWYRVILPDTIYTQLSDPVSGPGAHIHAYTFSAGYDGVTTARIERSV
jgi:hypothetical protein